LSSLNGHSIQSLRWKCASDLGLHGQNKQSMEAKYVMGLMHALKCQLSGKWISPKNCFIAKQTYFFISEVLKLANLFFLWVFMKQC